jgi:predicted transglutaminase-like cysteine proteinase
MTMTSNRIRIGAILLLASVMAFAARIDAMDAGTPAGGGGGGDPERTSRPDQAKAEQTHYHGMGGIHMSLAENELAPQAFIEFCNRNSERCAVSEETRQITLNDQNLRQLDAVNRAVNLSITFLDDPPGVEKPWQDDARVGDCDAYALAKRSRLLDLKQPSSALLLTVAIVSSGEAHLVLVVVTDRGDFVLDNLRQDILRWDRIPYHWVKRSSPMNPQFWQSIVSPAIALNQFAKLRDC